MSNREYHNVRLLPFSVIKAASNGEAVAINAVLKHYSGYISKLAMRRIYDENGRSMMCVDESLQRRFETKLMEGISFVQVATRR